LYGITKVLNRLKTILAFNVNNTIV